LAIGIIEPTRLEHIPPKHRDAHEVCFFLHDQIARLAVVYEQIGAGHIKVDLVSEEDVAALENAKDPIEFLIKTGRVEEERRLAINHICAALFPDMLHFIFEGLKALEKRKFTVAFSLLRKPFKEAMPVLAMMCADEEDFVSSFRTGTSAYFDGENFNAPYKKELISDAIEALGDVNFGDADAIFDMCLNMKNEHGLAQLFDKATHLFTSHKPIRTEDYNINFIFKDPRDNDVYDTTYYQLSYLLVFVHLMQVELLSRTGFDKKNYLSGFMMSALGAFDSVHGKGPSEVVKSVNENFSDLMGCGVCGHRVRLKKRDAARFFLLERINCSNCGNESQFPFTWLLDQAARESAPG